MIRRVERIVRIRVRVIIRITTVAVIKRRYCKETITITTTTITISKRK
jgi:hypothetical protein